MLHNSYNHVNNTLYKMTWDLVYLDTCIDTPSLFICQKQKGSVISGDKSNRLPPMWLRFDSRTQYHIWVEFVVGSCPCSERFFSWYSGFPLSLKTNISKFQFNLVVDTSIK